MKEFIQQNIWLVFPILVWSIFWKGKSLWRSAQKDQKVWFIILLICNTLGILDIIYLLTAGHRPGVTRGNPIVQAVSRDASVPTPTQTNPIPQNPQTPPMQ